MKSEPWWANDVVERAGKTFVETFVMGLAGVVAGGVPVTWAAVMVAGSTALSAGLNALQAKTAAVEDEPGPPSWPELEAWGAQLVNRAVDEALGGGVPSSAPPLTSTLPLAVSRPAGVVPPYGEAGSISWAAQAFLAVLVTVLLVAAVGVRLGWPAFAGAFAAAAVAFLAGTATGVVSKLGGPVQVEIVGRNQ